MLAEVLDVGCVRVRLAATKKDEVLHTLASMLVNVNANVNTETGVTTDKVYQVFSEREALASTGIGSGVAVPHGRLAGVDKLLIAIGIYPDGVEFNAIDGELVYIVIGILGSQERSTEHLQLLTRISRLLRAPTLRQRLVNADTAASAFQLLIHADANPNADTDTDTDTDTNANSV